jgi:hypothetical protein
MMIRESLLLLLVFLLTVTGVSAATPDQARVPLQIYDLSDKMSGDMYGSLVAKTNMLFSQINAYWSPMGAATTADPIVVEFMRQTQNMPNSFFFFRNENGARIKVVRVIGGGAAPQQLAHKLTSALLPHGDKLIRNMMGEFSEHEFGNPLSFPQCGASVDEWVAALIQSGDYVSLAKIGTSHADWGMEVINNAPVVTDRKKQHVRYAEAGSFGYFLIDSFGPKKMLEFYQRASLSHRPWQEVFGYPLMELEQRWLTSLKLKMATNQATVALIANHWQQDPVAACARVRDNKK